MVIPFVVPEILGGGGTTPPQMPLSCQKRQMPLTVKGGGTTPQMLLHCQKEQMLLTVKLLLQLIFTFKQL